MWHYTSDKGRYIFDTSIRERTTPRVATSVAATVASAETKHVYTHEELVLPGHLAESTGIASMKNGSVVTFDHDLDLDNAYTSLIPATAKSRNIVGVSIADNKIQRSGHALVWIVRPTTNQLPLTGAYNWSVNGIDQGKQIIFFNRADNSFLLARTADDELEKIRLRLEALTNSQI